MIAISYTTDDDEDFAFYCRNSLTFNFALALLSEFNEEDTKYELLIAGGKIYFI